MTVNMFGVWIVRGTIFVAIRISDLSLSNSHEVLQSFSLEDSFCFKTKFKVKYNKFFQQEYDV